ncbi:MAG: 30S ribosome-binding factor RbfA [Calditrichia bacterium]
MGTLRNKKLANLIKNELSFTLDRKVKDPRKGMITITEVRLNNDNSVATVFFSTLGSEEEKSDALKFLEHVKPYLRSELRTILKIRKIPELRFEIDNSFEYGQKIESLLKKIHQDQTESDMESGTGL